MEEMHNKEKFIKEGVEYSKIDIENALEFLSTNTTKNYKSDNTGEEYSILYKNNRYAIKLVYEQMRIAKGLEYENKITATSIKTSFSAYYEILPRIGNNENPNSKKNILENLKKEFKSYLNNLYPNGYDKTYEYDPFYLINDRFTDIKDFCKENDIYFWKIFENDDNLERYYQVLKEKRPANTYNSYMSSTNRLKDFFNQKYGGYINWLRTLAETDNQEINFELIEDWAINYLGKYHDAGNTDSGTKGPKVIKEFKKLGNAVVSKFPDYTLSYYTSWQNSGKIYPYLWLQLKHKNLQDSPCSISIFVIKDNGKAKLCIETEIDDKNAKSKDYENFLKTLDTIFMYDNQWYWEDENTTKFQNIVNALDSVKKGDSKKIKTIKTIKSPYRSVESNRIINELQTGFEVLRPRYESIFESKSQQKENKMNIPLNQILYGPPGTGKTYNTVLKAMGIIDNKDYKDVSDEQYLALKTRFDELKHAGQIEFVTFHQSYSYEEFVEGIKPDCKNNNLKYMLQDGIFKNICKNAQELKELKTQYNFNFDNISAYKILIPDSELFDYCIENNCVAINWGKDIDVSECNSEQEIENKIPTTYESRKQCISQLKIFKLWIDEDLKNGKDVIVIIPGSLNTIKGIAKINGEYTYNEDVENGQQQRSVEWIRKNINISSENIYNAKFVSPTITGMYNEKINKENFLKLINNTNVLNAKNAVLIIDEINRGNISKIFGELITLIEEDKRENLTVTLPYSHEPFTVPENLYIIGTMNTSDRSIASIDIALRRRFKFVEMMPNSELLKPYRINDINLQELLDNLNERILYLLDRDHQIGHSYFMNWDNYDLKTLKDVWFNSIMPLLNEYFYLDWDRLQAILGEAKNTGSFIIKKTKPKLMCSVDCTDDDCYYHFSKKEDINNETFKDLLIKLIKPESENNV